MDLLAQVDDQLLKDIGISSAGHRLRIRNAITKLGAHVQSETAGCARDWLAGTLMFARAIATATYIHCGNYAVAKAQLSELTVLAGEKSALFGKRSEWRCRVAYWP